MTQQGNKQGFSRRSFLMSSVAGAAAAGFSRIARAERDAIPGFDEIIEAPETDEVWEPISDRKIRLGVVGYGLCQMGAAFYFQDHPNIEVVAVSDLLPDRCAGLAKALRCEKTYPSLEELIKDDDIEAVYLGTDAPAHAWHSILSLRHGKHVAVACPAVWGSLEDADRLYETVKSTGLKYMMFETSTYHNENYAMRKLYEAGALGELVYAEGEYYHYMDVPIPSFRDWRVGLPPQWYPTHSTAYHTSVTRGSFTEVSCLGMPSIVPQFQPENNPYSNPFGTEIALLRTSEGGMARMAVGWDTPGYGREMGRVRGEKGSVEGENYQGQVDISDIDIRKHPLPPTVQPGGHGGAHGYLTEEFVSAILEDRNPVVDIACSLNMTVAGVVAHESALKGGEWLKIPQYKPL